MYGLKKFHLSLLTILFSASFAQVAEATLIQDSKTRQHGGWYAELEGFHAKAKDSLLSTLPFANSFISEDVLSPTGDFFTLDDINHTFHPDWECGYRLAVGYDFPSCTCCTYGFSLEYTYHKTDDDRHLENVVNSLGFPSLDAFYGFDGAIGTNADADIDFKYHAVDLLGHKNLTVCNCVDVQLFAGARYARLKEDLHRRIFVPDDLADDILEVFPVIINFASDYESKFDGVGPRVGFNAFYQVGCGFGLLTEAAGNLLFGLTDSDYNERNFTTIDIGDGVLNIDSQHRTNQKRNAKVVPGLSGKVALAYRATFRNCSSLGIELGYRGDKYFGIANHSALVLPTDFDAGFIRNGNYHDFDIAGPYIAISFHA